MTDKAKLRDSVKKHVRALLISAPMGLSMRELERDYKEVIGERIPALDLGFNSAQDLLLDMPDVAYPQWERGDLVLFGVADSTTKHIQKLVSRQRKDKAKIKKKRAAVNRRSQRDAIYSYQQPPRRTGPSPFSSLSFKVPAVKSTVPASLQSQVKHILKEHPAGISSFEFKDVFYRVHNYDINFKKLGFDSLWEFVRAIPGVKASHVSKEEYDIFLVPENFRPIPAGYETSATAQKDEEDDVIYQPERARSKQVRTVSSEATSSHQSISNTQKQIGSRAVPSNSRSPWALAGVPRPVKKAASPRGRGRAKEPVPGNDSRNDRSTNPEPRVTSKLGPVSVEHDIEAPFEKKFVEEIRQILDQHPEGVWSIELPEKYKNLTGKSLQFFSMGYYSVIELVSAMPDVVTVVREDNSDWKLYDARKKTIETTPEPPSQDFQEEDVTSSGIDELSALDLVKGKLRALLEEFSDGILLEELESAYRNKYSKCLPLKQLGFHDIDSLILLIPDVVKVLYKGHGKVYAFAERETHGIPKYDSKMALLCSLPQDAVGYGYRFRDLEMPPLNEYFEVYVSSVYTPHKFTIQIRDKEKNAALEELMDDLEAIYKYPEGERYFFPVSMIAVNQLCCALYLEDNNWHRAVITGVIDNDFVEVNYVDYGSTLQVPKSCLRLLKACFLKLPAMAMDAKLANIEPVGDKWTAASRDKLLELTMEKPLIAYCTEIKNKVLSLFLCDTTTDNDIHINDVLVREEYAKFSVASSPSETLVPTDEMTFETPLDYNPSDFIMSVDQTPNLGPMQEEHVMAHELLLKVASDTGSHQVTEAGDHAEEEDEDDAALISHVNEEVEAESESDMEEIDEVENNLNLEDIELTMRFLEGRRKRLLAVLSSDEGVSAIDDLDETETLMRHFEERKKKIAALHAKSTEKVAPKSTSEPVVASKEMEKSVSSNTIQVDKSFSQEIEEVEIFDEESFNSESDFGNTTAEAENQPVTDTHEIIDPRTAEDYSTVDNDEESLPIVPPAGMDLRTDPNKPVVDPATLKDLGQMLRSSLKVTAEPFRPKQTAAVSPFRRPGVPLPTSPSAFLDNRDTIHDGSVKEQTLPQGGVFQPPVTNQPLDQTSQFPVQQNTYQPSMSDFYGQEQFVPPFQVQPPNFFPSMMGRGLLLPQRGVPGINQGRGPGMGGSGSDTQQMIGGTFKNPGVPSVDVPRMEPFKMEQPTMAHHIDPRVQEASLPNQKYQDIQQFYSGGLDMRQTASMPHMMRGTGPPQVRGMNLANVSGMGNFRSARPPMMPGMNISRPPNMPFPPPPNIRNFINNPSQQGVSGGVPMNMYGGPLNYNSGNRMYPPGAMGRGMGRGSAQ